MSDSNRVKITYVPETVFNTTPVDSVDWVEARVTGETLSATTNRTDSTEIRSDRQITSSSKVSRQAAGAMNIELTMNTFDDFIEAALAGTWNTNVLEVGTVERSFSIQKEFQDLSTVAYELFTGMRVGQMDLNIATGSLVTGSFNFTGAGESRGTVDALGLGTLTPATTNDVLNATSSIASLTIDGSSTGVCLTSLTMSVNNNLRENMCIGEEFANDIGYGSSLITGSFEAYLTYEMFQKLDAVADNTDVALSFQIGDGTNSYTILLPRLKLSADSPQATAKDTDVMITFNYTALLDSVTGTSLRITRA